MANFAAKDLTIGQVNALIKKIGGHESVLDILSGAVEFNLTEVAQKRAIITLSAQQTMSELLDYDNYCWVWSKIREIIPNLSTEFDGDWECDLWNPRGLVSLGDAAKACSEDGWMSANIHHFLVFGEGYKYSKGKKDVIALGCSDCNFGDGEVPILKVNGGRRMGLVHRDRYGDKFPAHLRFLRVRRLPSKDA